MREILFRGKATNRIEGRAYRTNYKNGDWVYGLLTEAENYGGFSEMTNTNGVCGIEVDPETVGQFTGLTDKNGKEVFEGDIVKISHKPKPYEVKYKNGCYCIGINWALSHEPDCEVIGNIHDNPELLTKNSAIDSPLENP